MKTEKTRKAVSRRKHHVRKKIFGVAERPRLAVFRSNRHIYAQIIDDVAGVTLMSVSTRAKALRDKVSYGGNKKAAEIVGETVAKQAIGVGIGCVRFDRSSYLFHGRTKALADAARKAGLVF